MAKPLHVGHLRSAIIGESIKRMGRFMGHNMIGDVHLGDWGLQMGLIITELQERHPELVYFDESFTGEYPEEAPFTISELEEIYPCASGKSKEDEDYKKTCTRGNERAAAGQKRISCDLETHYERFCCRSEKRTMETSTFISICGWVSPMHRSTFQTW